MSTAGETLAGKCFEAENMGTGMTRTLKVNRGDMSAKASSITQVCDLQPLRRFQLDHSPRAEVVTTVSQAFSPHKHLRNPHSFGDIGIKHIKL